MADLATILAIRYLKQWYWTPDKIRRLLDAAKADGSNPLGAAHAATEREALANLRPAARRYVKDLERARD